MTQILSWWKGQSSPQRMRSRKRSPQVWQGRRKLRGTTENIHLTGVPRVSLARLSACEGLFFFLNCCKKNKGKRGLEMKENSHAEESGQWMKRLGHKAAWGRTANRLSTTKNTGTCVSLQTLNCRCGLCIQFPKGCKIFFSGQNSELLARHSGPR